MAAGELYCHGCLGPALITNVARGTLREGYRPPTSDSYIVGFACGHWRWAPLVLIDQATNGKRPEAQRPGLSREEQLARSRGLIAEWGRFARR